MGPTVAQPLQLQDIQPIDGSIPGTLAKGLAGAHFGEKNQIALKNKAVE
jgi:hypothetical protein